MRELRVRSYAKLMGLKIPMTQVVRTHGEAKILCEYYDARFHITHDVSDLEESKKQNERSLAFIQEISKLGREISEVLGEVKIAFPASDELNQAVHAVYSSSAIDVPEVRGTVATVEALDAWKTRIVKSLASMVQAEYANKIESLLVMLYPSTDKA